MPDVPRYALAVTLDPEHARFEGELSLVYTHTQAEPLDSLLLRLLPNGGMCYGNGALRVDEGPMVNGLEVQSTPLANDTSQLWISLPAALAPGEHVRLNLTFSGSIPIDFGGEAAPYAYGIYNLTENVLTLASWYPILAVYENGAWRDDRVLPLGDSVFSQMAFYEVEITAPEAWRVVTTGELTGQSPAGEGWVRYTYGSVLARDFFITASPDFLVLNDQVEGVMIHAYYLPGSETGANQTLAVGMDAVSLYSESFGDYPYTELDIVQAPMRNALGVEYPGIVLIGSEGYADASDPSFAITVAHEVAHQWWYNVVGNDVFREPWLDEGLTTYSSGLYYEYAAGAPGYEGVRSYWQQRYDKLVQEGRDAPLTWSLEDYVQHDPKAYSPVAYSKGALFFDALRKEVGDEAFFDALRLYYEAQQYQIAKGDDLRAAFIQAAGVDVEAFLDAWLME